MSWLGATGAIPFGAGLPVLACSVVEVILARLQADAKEPMSCQS